MDRRTFRKQKVTGIRKCLTHLNNLHKLFTKKVHACNLSSTFWIQIQKILIIWNLELHDCFFFGAVTTNDFEILVILMVLCCLLFIIFRKIQGKERNDLLVQESTRQTYFDKLNLTYFPITLWKPLTLYNIKSKGYTFITYSAKHSRWQ